MQYSNPMHTLKCFCDFFIFTITTSMICDLCDKLLYQSTLLNAPSLLLRNRLNGRKGEHDFGKRLGIDVSKIQESNR